jgi:hypothetical protein
MDPASIRAYMTGFYGYGSWNQPTWFIGMEEGGCDTLDEFYRRVEAWSQRGQKELEDAPSYHEAIGVNQWFRPGARLQKTWEQLIRVYLSLYQRPADKDSVKRFQIENFGHQEAEGFATVELFPLPKPSIDAKWFYSSIAELPELASREAYTSFMYPKRVEKLRQQIRVYKPKHVICYGLAYRPKWEELVGQRLENTQLQDVSATKVDNTVVLLMPHPVSHGKTQDYWREVGKLLKDRS